MKVAKTRCEKYGIQPVTNRHQLNMAAGGVN